MEQGFFEFAAPVREEEFSRITRKLSESRLNELDSKFPIEEIRFNYGLIWIRAVENGIFLWGMRWHVPQLGQGGGFPPLRKWGSQHAAKSRDDAITQAVSWFDKKYSDIAVARIHTKEVV